jgi:pilus assembly protein CpaB
MTRRIVAITVAIVLAALGAAGGLFLIVTTDQRAQDRLTDGVTVAVARTRIALGTPGSRVRADDLVQYIRLPKANVPAEAIGQLDASYDKLVLTSNVAKDQILLKGNFGAPAEATSGLALPDGKIAVTVETGAPEQVAGYVQAGSQVAIFLTYRPNDGSGDAPKVEKTRVLLPRVEVLAVGTYQPRSDGTASAGGRSGSLLITVGVTQAEAERLIQGLNTGTLYLGLLTDSVDVRPGPGVDNRDNSSSGTPLFK